MELIRQKSAEILQKTAAPGAVKFDPMTILVVMQIVTVAIKMLIACRDLSRARRPGIIARYRLWWAVQRECAGRDGLDPREVFDLVLHEGLHATRPQLMAAVREVEAAENLPGVSFLDSEDANQSG